MALYDSAKKKSVWHYGLAEKNHKECFIVALDKVPPNKEKEKGIKIKRG